MSETSFGKRLKMLRKKMGDSQKEFAKRVEVAESTISKYETNLRNPDSVFLAKLKKSTNVNLNWLIGGEGDSDSMFTEKAPPGIEDLSKQVSKLQSTILKEFKAMNTK
ncbi:MAG: helix-turn-helix transcriptional regulator [Candidatus Aminicenantes bacterium]|nr:helix-turn-helix transcriptional regulator [Candidatus Aminicenantes bacterium]